MFRMVFLPGDRAFIRFTEIPGDDPPLLWLHGIMCSSTGELMQAAVQPELRGRRQLLIDFLGYGYGRAEGQPTKSGLVGRATPAIRPGIRQAPRGEPRDDSAMASSQRKLRPIDTRSCVCWQHVCMDMNRPAMAAAEWGRRQRVAHRGMI